MNRSSSAPGFAVARSVLSAWLAALLFLGGGAQAADTQEHVAPASDAAATIRSIIHSDAVRTRLSAWGLSVADVQLDVDTMSPSQRARLMRALLRPWPVSRTYSRADLQAQYLVMVSLMRESTLFASVLGSGPGGLE